MQLDRGEKKSGGLINLMEINPIDTDAVSSSTTEDATSPAQRRASFEAHVTELEKMRDALHSVLEDDPRIDNLIQDLRDRFLDEPSSKEESFFSVDAIHVLMVLVCVKCLVVGNLKQTIVVNGFLGMGYLYRYRRESMSFGDLLLPSLVKLIVLFVVNNPYLVTSVGLDFVASRRQGRSRSALLTLSFVLTCIYYSKRPTASGAKLSNATVKVGRRTLQTVLTHLPPLEEYPGLLREGLQVPSKISAIPVVASCVLLLATLLHSSSKADATMLQVLTGTARSVMVA